MIAPQCIVGAGLAGLLAAHAWPMLPILEAGPRRPPHAALLRFRSDAVARAVGIEFRRVTVRKGIWMSGAQVPPSIAAANLYSQKCLGRLVGERSIWNLDAAERFIAPDDFYDQLLEAVGSRIQWSTQFNFDAPCISTAPMPVALAIVGQKSGIDRERWVGLPDDLFCRAPIFVERHQLPDCDVHQTLYFPDPEETPVYRASITGSTLIVESVGMCAADEDLSMVVHAFGIVSGVQARDAGIQVHQSHGKIVSLPDGLRKSLLFELTSRHGIFSLGRYATWRNILLDDVIDDIAVIKRLLRSDAALHYDARKV